jgi:hypothetical protein
MAARSALYLYVNLFTFHNVPFLLLGDQTFFWEYAFRILQGDHVYRDFLQFTPPGTDLFYLALLKLFGPFLSVVNLGLVLLCMGLFWRAFLSHIASCLGLRHYSPQLSSWP